MNLPRGPRPRHGGAPAARRVIGPVLAAVLAPSLLVLAGCGAPPAPSGGAPSSGGNPASGSSDSEQVRSRNTLAYLSGWSANRPEAMVRTSSPGSPARAYADYWGGLLAAGRVDSDAAEVELTAGGAAVTYPDGTTYKLQGFEYDDSGLLESWATEPGGELADRIVAGPPESVRIGDLRVTARQQYRNSAGDLRIILTVDNIGDGPVRLGTDGYRSAGGRKLGASLGAAGETGVIEAAPRGVTDAVASVPGGEPGGLLMLAARAPSAGEAQRAKLQLPGGAP